MRILMVGHSNAGWTLNCARFFLSNGDELLLASFSPHSIEGIMTECIGGSNYNADRHKHLYFTRVPRLRRILRQFKPDIVFATYLASNGLIAGLSWSGPLVVSAVGSDVLYRGEEGWLRRRFREEIIKFVARRADVINTVSAELDEELIRLGASKSKLLRIPFGVDLEVYHPSKDMPRPTATRFVCTRKHGPYYDMPTVIEALGLLKGAGRKFHCTLTSDGPQTEDLKKLVSVRGLQEYVTFTGFLGHAELPDVLRQADIYISASLYDGASVSLFEAMATGLFPVVSRITANEPWIEHKRTGLLFETRRPDLLADALQTATDNVELRKHAFKENISRVDRDCNTQRNMLRLAGVFKQLVAGKVPPFPV